MTLEPKEFLLMRFEFIKDYPGAPFRIGDILDTYESQGEIYLRPDNVKIYPLKFPDNFKKLRWWEHRTIEQLLSIKYMKVVSHSNYYVPGDIVEVTKMFYNNESLVGGKNSIQFDLKGHYFLASQLEPATSAEYEKFKHG